MTKKVVWTPAIDDAMETLLGLEENLSYEKVAELLTARFDLPFTRNSCIGRSHRLRLPPRAPHRVARKAKVITMPVRVDAPIPPKEAKRLPDSRNLTLLQLDYGVCKWPEGNSPPYLYCGTPTLDGASFCPDHYVICYQKPRKEFS